MKWFLLFMLTILSGAAALAADTQNSTALDKLKIFAGAWKSDSQNFDTIYSSAGAVSSLQTNACGHDGDFYVCNQSSNGVSRVLLVFTYKGGDTYGVTYVPADGSRAVSGELLIAGNTWTYPGQITKFGQVTYLRTVNVFTNPDTIEYRQEFSVDQQNWTLMAQGRETRIK
ncbi:MAG TPA: hypothetical protein VLG68_10450 [Gammaproteobacteria bacterium]|nr:hypothetical protein [Gammaproteobacteria bacterium]